MNKALLPGLSLALLVSLISLGVQELIVIGGKNPLEATAVGVLLGLILRNSVKLPDKFLPGIKYSEKLLGLGIVLLGATLNFSEFAAHGFNIFVIIASTMLVGGLVTAIAARSFRLSSNLSLLITVGTIICGGTAIAVTAPLIEAKEDETAYAIGTITLWGLVAIFIYPSIGKLLGFSDWEFGVFAGTAIHSTPQVVGAGYIFSPLAGAVATGVKLVRNCFIVPLAFLIAWQAKRANSALGKTASRAFPWFLFGYFITAGLRSLGLLPQNIVDLATTSGKFFVLISMAGIGLNTGLAALKTLGIRPILAGLIGAVAVAATSFTLIKLMPQNQELHAKTSYTASQ